MQTLKQLSRKVRVLVFPCGTEIGLEIHRSLQWSTHIDLFGASSVASDHGRYVYHQYVEQLPFVEASNFVTSLNKVINDNEIDLIFPAHDSVVLALSEIADSLRCKVIGSPAPTCQVCRSKRKTYELFGAVLEVPKVYNINSDMEFPVFLKPDVGQGSRGIEIAKSEDEVQFYVRRNPELIPMEFLSGKEYTVDCFSDSKGTLRFIGPRQRIRVVNGISVDTFPVDDARLDTMAEKINGMLKFRGAWFFQAKERADGDLVLLEIAPRIAGAMGLYRNLGVNLALLSIFDRLEMDIEILPQKHFLEMDRALINRFRSDLDYDTVYIDLDDTILVDGSVNIWVIAFLYQCRNKGIKLHLLSHHRKDIEVTLANYRLEMLFDTVSNLDDNEEKADYITNRASLFIDDSFCERKRVATKLGIPTFDVQSIESLLDWRS